MEHEIWIEKYRPKTFSDIKGQVEIVKRVQALVEKQNIPHLLFAGPAGLGKSTMAIVIARELFKDSWHGNFLELNASDERGIDIVRNKIKDFARTKALSDVPFKVIFLDECDALTKEAQQALRRTMENYAQTTRFLLSCNYSSKIIDPIQSRCTVFRFKPLKEEHINEIIDLISQKENLQIDQDARKALFSVSRGDVRRLENILQASAAVKSQITAELVYNVASFARPAEVKTILESCTKQNFKEAKKQLLKVMLEYGLAGVDIIKQLQAAVWQLENVPDRTKLELSKACGEAEFRMIEGADEYIQLEALIATFCLKASQ